MKCWKRKHIYSFLPSLSLLFRPYLSFHISEEFSLSFDSSLNKMRLSILTLTSILCSASAFVPQSTKPIFTSITSSSRHHVISDASSSTIAAVGKPGTAELDTPWEELGFEFRPTKSNLRITYKNGEWGELELCEVSKRV